jgi:ATP-dependent protease ClpP protease subunit
MLEKQTLNQINYNKMLYVIQKDIHEELVTEFAQKINEFKSSEFEELSIMICSEGGSIHSKEALLDMINTNKEMICLTAFGCINSAAFLLFLRAKCKKKILPLTSAIVHNYSIRIDVNQNKKIGDRLERKTYNNSMKELKDTFKDEIQSIGLTEKEIKDLKKDGEIKLEYKRLVEIFG